MTDMEVTRRRNGGFTLVELLIAMAIVGLLAGVATPAYYLYLDKARIARAIAEIRYIEKSVNAFYYASLVYPNNLTEAGSQQIVDPWGTPYQYLKLADNGQTGKGKSKPEGKPRKDRFLVPINSDFDLYSMGKDRESVAPLTAKKSHDDIVRANDGAFIGLASHF